MNQVISEHVKNQPTKDGVNKICQPRQRMVFNELKREHSRIMGRLRNFEKSLVRVGKNLIPIRKFVNFFDKKIYIVIESEESILFPYLKQHIEEGPLFVMTYTHEKIKDEFEKLKKASYEQNIFDIHKYGIKLIEVLRYHIEKEDSIILNETEKILNPSQINCLSSRFLKSINAFQRG